MNAAEQLQSKHVQRPKKQSAKAARLEYNDRLITAVHKRPVLWDCCRSDYKDPRKKMTAWKEVLADCGRDPAGCSVQTRWKSLRDTFIKKHRAWKTGATRGSGGDDEKSTRWPYFKLLIFLKDQVDISNTASNATEGTATDGESAEGFPMSMYGNEGDFNDEELPLHDADTMSSPSSASTSSAEPVLKQELTEPTLIEKRGPRNAQKRSSEKKSKIDRAIDAVDQLLKKDEDEAALFGQIVAHKLRSCPKDKRASLEIQVLEVFRRSECNDE